jgi:hypothetical protein
LSSSGKAEYCEECYDDLCEEEANELAEAELEFRQQPEGIKE